MANWGTELRENPPHQPNRPTGRIKERPLPTEVTADRFRNSNLKLRASIEHLNLSPGPRTANTSPRTHQAKPTGQQREQERSESLRSNPTVTARILHQKISVFSGTRSWKVDEREGGKWISKQRSTKEGEREESSR
jgi:hypothetical protein